jgi:hypothetical protein
MGQCKQLDIETRERAQWLEFITNAPLECGSIGVCLDDTRNPPRYYELDGYIDMQTVELVLLDSRNKNRMYTRRVPIEIFWPLT